MAQLVEQLIRNEQVASSSLAIGFFILSKLPSADSHYNFCRFTKIVSSANKFAYGYVTFGLPALTNISCRVFAIGFFILSKLPSADSHYNFCRLLLQAKEKLFIKFCSDIFIFFTCFFTGLSCFYFKIIIHIIHIFTKIFFIRQFRVIY